MNTNPGGPGSVGDDGLSFSSLAHNQSDGSGTGPGSYLVQDGSGGAIHHRSESHDGEEDGGGGETEVELREQDRFLPIANVARIMKKSIPTAQGKIAKDARECVQECVSEFISFITSEASDRCQAEKRKTINGEDILFAMSTLGFDNYVEPLKLYLQKYREGMKGDKQGNEEFEGLGEDVLGKRR
eukprot:TCALIF_11206-PA protein Name:"Similar to NFYB Nuclear transcription factor Y subunit beta (Homo sapiens)" AED:0.45 eAED:0.45 QI:0/0/0/0.66/1/1/3/0/184